MFIFILAGYFVVKCCRSGCSVVKNIQQQENTINISRLFLFVSTTQDYIDILSFQILKGLTYILRNAEISNEDF